jgi:uncharacterized integral membrane protein
MLEILIIVFFVGFLFGFIFAVIMAASKISSYEDEIQKLKRKAIRLDKERSDI